MERARKDKEKTQNLKEADISREKVRKAQDQLCVQQEHKSQKEHEKAAKVLKAAEVAAAKAKKKELAGMRRRAAAAARKHVISVEPKPRPTSKPALLSVLIVLLLVLV